MKKQQQIADFLQMLRQCEGTIFHVCYKFTDRTPEAAPTSVATAPPPPGSTALP